MKIILAGGTGTMGLILQQHFAERGDEVVVLTRRPLLAQHPKARMVRWNARTPGPWTARPPGPPDGRVANHLAPLVAGAPAGQGASIPGRWRAG